MHSLVGSSPSDREILRMLTDRRLHFSWQLCELWKNLQKHCMLSEGGPAFAVCQCHFCDELFGEWQPKGISSVKSEAPPDDSWQEGTEGLKSGWQRENPKLTSARVKLKHSSTWDVMRCPAHR